MGFFLLLFIILSLFISIRLFLYRTTLIHRLKKWGHWIEDSLHVHQSLKVPELDENHKENLFYRKVYTYLNSLSTIEDSDNINLISGKHPKGVVLCLDDDQTIQDTFLGARVSWTNKVERLEEKNVCKKTFVLKMKKKDKRRVMQSYVQHIYRACEDVDSRGKELKLFMNTENHRRIGRWSSVKLSHPATFETIAMDSDLKKKVKTDLDLFIKSKQYYHRLGRVWKRSYLLYGPSGTGKSSFIAAMAKYLSYDVYEIDLTKVVDDSDLKTLLLQTTRKSLIVVEDLDRFLTSNTNSTRVRLTLTGVLNFMDGVLNSCCGDEKLMVFTMNNKDKIESSVLRPGRIDVHIYFPLCTFNSFKTLANNCLGLKDHKLFSQVEEMIQTGSTISPAEMSELMMSNRGSPGRALKSVITALQINGDPRLSSSNEDSASPVETSSVFVMDGNCSVPVVKEIQKLYGLLRMKSSKKVGPSDQYSGSMERSR